MLVVMAIIAILIAMILPALKRTVQQARSAVCKHNLRQIHLALQTYQLDNDGWLPVNDPNTPVASGWPGGNGQMQPWFAPLYPTYLGDLMVFACPEDPYRFRLLRAQYLLNDPDVADFPSYGISSVIMRGGGGLLANLDRYQPTRPLDTVFLADAGPDFIMGALPSSADPVDVGPARNGCMLSLNDAADPLHEGYPWLTDRHGFTMNTVTIGGSVREIHTSELFKSEVLPHYPNCDAGGCTFCRLFSNPSLRPSGYEPPSHYSFWRDRLFWYTGPWPTE
jgi:type II secretory pathway pseudopilin PulG